MSAKKHQPFVPENMKMTEFTARAVIIGILLTLMGGLVVLKQLDRAWILVRRAAGIDQRSGVIGRVFMYTAIIGASLFGLWMIFGGGLANSLNPPPTN